MSLLNLLLLSRRQLADDCLAHGLGADAAEVFWSVIIFADDLAGADGLGPKRGGSPAL